MEDQAQKSFVVRQIFRLVTRVIGWAALLLLLFLLIFQIPGVQNWLAAKVTKTISEKAETTVSIERAYLSFFDHLILKKVYIEDHQADTLLYAGKLDVDFNLNPYVLLTKG